MGSTFNVLASLGLRWWQHKHCIAAEVIGYRKSIIIPRIQLCPSDATIHFKLCRRRFPIKLVFAMTINMAQGQRLNVLECIIACFSHDQLCVVFFRTSSFDDVAVAIIEGHRQGIED
jgi:hypothetical protein